MKYCFGLKNRSRIGKNESEKINWLPVSNSVDQWSAVTACNFKNALSPKYMDDNDPCKFQQTLGNVGQLTVSLYLFIKKEIARKSISYLGSKIWNDLNQDLKASASANSFKHALKKRFFKS